MPLGKQACGLQMRGHVDRPANPRVLVKTDGLLLSQLLSDEGIPEAAVVILDEIHERSINMDTCMALLKRVSKAASARRTSMLRHSYWSAARTSRSCA